MINDEEVRSIVKNSTPSTSDKMKVLQKFIFDKKGVEVEMSAPTGKPSFNATMRAGTLVQDVELLEYFYGFCLDFYQEKFKLTENG